MTGLFITFLCLLILVECSSSQDCGKSNVKPTDVEKSEDAEPNAWPWMVAVTKIDLEGESSPKCNGFLIDNQHVLTAATCLGDDERYLFSTSIGNIDQTKGQEYSIKKIHIHPGYRNGDFNDNIALMTLDRAVDNSGVSPICLPRSKEFMNITGMETIVAGWGNTGDKFQAMSLTLKQLNPGPVITNRDCRFAWGALAKYLPSKGGHFCAGFMEQGKRTFCSGDSGSPLMLKTDDKWYAVGIMSFRVRCRPQYPVGYTTIMDYLSWIDRIIGDDS